MKITDKIISIPPYISTSWDKVSSLHMLDDILTITLQDGTKVFIPHLPEEIINQLFTTHTAHLEQQAHAKPQSAILNSPMKIVLGTVDSLMQALQHNPANSNLPPIPPEIASKMEAFAKALPAEDIMQMPDPVPNCNCMYCQMQRILKQSIDTQADAQPQIDFHEETVADDELHFEEWNVRQTGDKMYLVTNKIDTTEQYTVYLGEPIGCTCGKPHCEHVIAVLRH